MVTMGRRNRALALVGLILLACLLGAVVDNWVANREMEQLVRATADSEAATSDGVDDVSASTRALTDLVDERSQTQPDIYEQRRLAALAGIRRVASNAAADVRASGAEVEVVEVMPWHGDIKDARMAYMEHNDAWAHFLREIAEDSAAIARESSHSDLGHLEDRREPLPRRAAMVGHARHRVTGPGHLRGVVRVNSCRQWETAAVAHAGGRPQRGLGIAIACISIEMRNRRD